MATSEPSAFPSNAETKVKGQKSKVQNQRSKVVHRLYTIIDRRTAQLSEIHAARLHCGRGCSSCCVDELTVFAVEAAHIQQHNAVLLAHGTPHPPGACAFLDIDGSCTSTPNARMCAARKACLCAGWTKTTRAKFTNCVTSARSTKPARLSKSYRQKNAGRSARRRNR